MDVSLDHIYATPRVFTSADWEVAMPFSRTFFQKLPVIIVSLLDTLTKRSQREHR